MKNKKGFTLIELLAVIAILGLLMGIAVPTSISISKKVKIQMFNKKLDLASSAAKLWGMENKSCLEDAYKDPHNSYSVNCPITCDKSGTILSCDIKLEDLAKKGYLKFDDYVGGNGIITDPRNSNDNMNILTVKVNYNYNSKSVNTSSIDGYTITKEATKTVKKSTPQSFSVSSNGLTSRSISGKKDVSSISKIIGYSASKGNISKVTINGTTISYTGSGDEYSINVNSSKTVLGSSYVPEEYCPINNYYCPNGGVIKGTRCVAGGVKLGNGVTDVYSDEMFEVTGSTSCHNDAGTTHWECSGNGSSVGCAGYGNYYRLQTMYGGGAYDNADEGCNYDKKTPIEVVGICQWVKDYNASCSHYEGGSCNYNEKEIDGRCYSCNEGTQSGKYCIVPTTRTDTYYEYDFTISYYD